MPIDIYARVSKMKRDEKRERSPEGQVGVCRAVLADHGLDEGEVLVDPGRSAWNPKVTRPAWDRLMNRLESGESDGVIVFDLERFSRQPDDGSRLIKMAKRGIIVLDSESEYDLRTPNGIKAFRDALNAAEYYSNRLSSRVKRGRGLKARAGEIHAASRPFGFLDASHKPGDPPPGLHPDEKLVMREMHRRLLAGEPQDALMADLNTRGILTSYGHPWTYSSLRAVLLRPLNAGLVEYRGQIVAQLPGEPLISRDDHERIVAMFAARRRGRPPSPKYICTGGSSLCGLCRRPLHGRPRTGSTYQDGEQRREYWCGPKPPGCGRIAIDQRGLDAFARNLTLTILSDPKNAAQIEAQAASTADEAARLDEEIGEAETVIAALGDRLSRGEMPLDRYDAITGPLDRRLAALLAERHELKHPDVPEKQSRAEWDERWKEAGPGERRRLLRLALRGRALVVGPADPADRKNIYQRVTLTPAS